MQSTKELYVLWNGIHKALPKNNRYTIGNKIDNLLTEMIETISYASFLPKNEIEEKLISVKISVRKNDTIKLFVMILWESRSIDDKKYANLSQTINYIGRMLGGWSGQLAKARQAKQNSPITKTGEK